MVVLIDLPLEIAFARKLRQYIAWVSDNESPSEALVGCDAFIASYLDSGRDINALVTAQARTSSDLLVDGLLAMDALAAMVAQSVRSHLGRE